MKTRESLRRKSLRPVVPRLSLHSSEVVRGRGATGSDPNVFWRAKKPGSRAVESEPAAREQLVNESSRGSRLQDISSVHERGSMNTFSRRAARKHCSGHPWGARGPDRPWASDVGVCVCGYENRTILLRKPLPRRPAAEPTLQPLIWCFESPSAQESFLFGGVVIYTHKLL